MGKFDPIDPNDEVNKVQLTEEETNQVITYAIYMAKREKLSKMKIQEWTNKVNQPLEEIKYNYEQTQALALRKARDLMGGKLNKFILTPEEEEIYKTICLYFAEDEDFLKRGKDFSLKKGLALFGGVGCGKTTVMKLFAGNTKQSYIIKPCAAIAREYVTEGTGVIDKYSEMQENRNKAFTFNHAALGICFDDLGTEDDKNHFGNKANVMTDILLAIYDKQFVSGFKVHITTNLTADEIEEKYTLRIRSRIREMFNIIKFPAGIDKRK